MTPAEVEKERLLAAMEFSLSTLAWAGRMDEYEKICKLIREAPEREDTQRLVNAINHIRGFFQYTGDVDSDKALRDIVAPFKAKP